MRVRYHIVASAGISLGVQTMTHSWPASLGCFLSGVLLDIDHYFEYCIIKKKVPFRYQDLVDFCEVEKDGRVYLLFHGYEYLVVLWVSFYFLPVNVAWVGVALGATSHILFDQFTNPVKPLFYFLFFRIKNKFEKSRVYSEAYFQRIADREK